MEGISKKLKLEDLVCNESLEIEDESHDSRLPSKRKRGLRYHYDGYYSNPLKTLSHIFFHSMKQEMINRPRNPRKRAFREAFPIGMKNMNGGFVNLDGQTSGEPPTAFRGSRNLIEEEDSEKFTSQPNPDAPFQSDCERGILKITHNPFRFGTICQVVVSLVKKRK